MLIKRVFLTLLNNLTELLEKVHGLDEKGIQNFKKLRKKKVNEGHAGKSKEISQAL